MKKFLKDNYNVAAITCGITTILLIIYFLKAERDADANDTYYLISVSAIYATIQLGYLLQKVLTIRQHKTNLLTNFNELWEAILHYRYLVALADSFFRQNDLHRYQAAKSLAATRSELIIYKFTGDENNIDKLHLEELKKKMEAQGFSVGYALMVKQAIFFGKDVYAQVGLNNRIYANNNATINAYIRGMLESPVFSLLAEENLIELNNLTDQITRHQFYNGFKIKAGLNKSSMLENLVEIERYVLNQVLFKLHDHTFLIEEPLPKPFLHLVVNSLTILLCGTILPLFNAFFAGSKNFILVCGALTIGALLLSMTYIALTFREENLDSVFKLVPVVYEGKEDINK